MTEKHNSGMQKPARQAHPDAPEKAKAMPSAERKHDKSLEESFPASDPVKPASPTGDDDSPRGRIDRKTPRIDKKLVDDLARELKRDLKRGAG